MKTYKISLLIILLGNFISMCNAQMQTEWARRYSGPSGYLNVGNALKVDEFGNVYVTGIKEMNASLSVCTIIKYNSIGDLVWYKDYQKPGSSYNVGRDLIIDKLNYIYVAGSVSLLKYKDDGSLIWTAYDSAAFYKVVIDREGFIYAGGLGFGRYVIVKYDQEGNKIWKRNNVGGYKFCSMKLDNTGNVVVLGESLTGGGSDYTTLKYSKTGEFIWMKKYYGLAKPPSQVPGSMALDDKNNIYVTGASQDASSTYNSVTIKYDSSGNELWIKRIYPPTSGHGVVIDNEYNVYYAAKSSSNNYAIKLNKEGDVSWIRTYPLTNALTTNRLEVYLDSAKNFYMTANLNDPNTQYGVIKYDVEGNRQYVLSYSASPTSYNYVQDMEVDQYGSVYITGESNSSIATVKYSILTNVPILNNIPSNFSLSNYPNPFNPTTKITYTLPKTTNVKLSIYDFSGKLIQVLVNEEKHPGSYNFVFEGSMLASGAYILEIRTTDYSAVKKILLLR